MSDQPGVSLEPPEEAVAAPVDPQLDTSGPENDESQDAATPAPELPPKGHDNFSDVTLDHSVPVDSALPPEHQTEPEEGSTTPRESDAPRHVSAQEEPPITDKVLPAAASEHPEVSLPGQEDHQQEPAPGRASTSSTTGSAPPLLSGVLMQTALDQILNSKEAKKNPELKESADRTLAGLKSQPSKMDSRALLHPLRLACNTGSSPLRILALDSIGKLVTFTAAASTKQANGEQGPDSEEPSAQNKVKPDPALANDVVDIICSCFIESPAPNTTNNGPEAVNLHILSALLSLILSPNPALPVHQSALLSAVRTVYNIFLLSRGQQNQAVAQGALGQMVTAIFSRVATDHASVLHIPSQQHHNNASSSSSSFARDARKSNAASHAQSPKADADPEQPHVERSGETPSDVEHESSTIEHPDQPSSELQNSETEGEPAPPPPEEKPVTLQSLGNMNASTDALPEVTSAAAIQRLAEDPVELHARDAYLIFRSLCKLSMKTLGSESERDLKSHGMRSKLLSLQLLKSILHAYMPIFASPDVLLHNNTGAMSFGQAVKQYLFLQLSRNAPSAIIQVFELSCDIFWRVVMGMRKQAKKEIEVLLTEVFLPILESRHSTSRQKSVLLSTLARLCEDPQTLVDIYINYDCDRNSIENIYERLINIISRLGTTQYTTVTPAQPSSGSGSGPGDMINAPAGSSVHIGLGTQEKDPYGFMPYEHRLKRQSLEALIATLRSLVAWAGRSGVPPPAAMSSSFVNVSSSELSVPPTDEASHSNDDIRPPGERMSMSEADAQRPGSVVSGVQTPDLQDDPGRFESAKQRKTTLLEGLKLFNSKPNKGMAFFVKHGFVPSSSAEDIASFLLKGEGLSKAAIGEYLGEGDADNIAAMHAFVDKMDFAGLNFTDALRQFLQSFRLPGESQKIDRFMLKFADRYMAGNPASFANADTAYVLSYSVVMLNTDLYNPQNRNRMTKADFVKNNRGIDDGKDIPEETLGAIYDDIATTEIRMKDEIDLSGLQQQGGLVGALAGVGRDLQREAYVLESEGMATKTEGLFRNMLKSQRRGGEALDQAQFFSASHSEHVKPMFALAWMPILAGISGPLQDSDEQDMIQKSLEGFKLAIKIVCLFDLELERNAFVSTLAKFTFLNNLGEMKTKNVEAIKALLDVAIVDGNYLKESWREVITCVSQHERFQLITSGVDSNFVPDMNRRPSHQTPTRPRSSTRRQSVLSSRPTEHVAHQTKSTGITVAADRIFSTSNSLSGTAIVDFARALADVSWEEIQSSGLTEHPRTFCLQKLVEISYYNMNRIRLEWSGIWAVLGEHFNQVCCHTNVKVSFFALDSLRQLASRFLEKEELAHFKFQKDFLKPFEYAMSHNRNPDVRDMILQCIRQMIQARAANLRSGWHTMFGVFSAASKVMAERIASQAFDMVKALNREHFSDVIQFGSFADLAVCITDFCKINKFQKISLHAIEMLKGLVIQMLDCPECPLQRDGPRKDESQPVDDPMYVAGPLFVAPGTCGADYTRRIKYWFPVLFGFYDITMNGEDLEVRKRALEYLFDTLKKYGNTFPEYFWDLVCKEVLFPIFTVLRSRSDVSRFSTHEDMSVWLSTTMIQALRSLVDLFTHYFDVLSRMLDRILDLLCVCICQENDTLARIGTSCLQQLIEQNVQKLTPQLWEKITDTMAHLFQTTTAHQLFDERLRMPISPRLMTQDDPMDKNTGFVPPLPLSPGIPTPETASSIPDRKRAFRQMIVKCVLQLLLIETSHELLQNDDIYTTIPPSELLKLMSALEDSYHFSKRFNANKDLRMALWKVGFMKQMPNLLRQESSSAATLVTVLLRLYNDDRPEHASKRPQVLESYTPLARQIVDNYLTLDPETQARNVAAWTPVVTEVLQGFAGFEDETLAEHTEMLFPLMVELLATDLQPDVREGLRSLLYRIGVVKGLMMSVEEEESIQDGLSVHSADSGEPNGRAGLGLSGV